MLGRVSMADVAREADVSLTTVSRVVRNKGEVSPATRKKVLEVIERLGYRPNSIARGLATERTGTLGLVIPDVANPFFSDVALGMENEAYGKDYNVFLCNTGENPKREIDLLHSLEEKRVDGVVLCSSRLEEEELRKAIAHHPSVVLINRELCEERVSTVQVDNELGGLEATRHLLNSGHVSIGFLAGPTFSRGGRQRASGYRAALQEANLPYTAEWIRHCAPSTEGGYKAAHELLTDHPKLTALFCYNDLVAVGALQACADLGRRVPEEVAIVGFDDIPLAALVTPSLTTCRVNRYELGVLAMRLLVKQIDGDTEGCEEITKQPELVIRNSAP